MRRASWVFLLCLAGATHGRAGTKEELARLQSDVLALQNQIRVLEKSVNESAGILKSLIAQLNDQIGRSDVKLSKITAALESQVSADRTGSEAVLREIRSLGTKVDDTGVRISALAQQVSDLKVQSKAVSARRFQIMGSDTGTIPQSADTVFLEAYNDLVQGNLDLAIQGFTAYVTNYPRTEKADDAQYYIGEAYYNDNKLSQAVGAFTRVVNEFPAGDKAASALYKRAMAGKQLDDRDSAVADLRSLIQRFPASAEAGLAQAELEGLGAGTTRGAPARTRRP